MLFLKGREYNRSAYNNEAMEKYISGKVNRYSIIIESVDSISRDEQDVPLTQYITNA